MGTTYKRILLKLSGEALKGDETGLYHYEAVDEICKANNGLWCKAAEDYVLANWKAE